MVQRQTQDESIYSLIPRKPREVEKADRYVSKNKTNLIGEAVVDQKRSQKESHKTMGLPNEHADVDPHSFTKKRSGEPKLKEPEKYHYPDEERKRPPVPRAQDAPPLMGMKTTKNFITTNAVENIMAVPKKPAANLADTRHGDTFPLEESGLVPKYRNKKDFGNTPNYIVKRADEMRRAQEEYDLYVKEHMRRGAMKQVGGAEHEEILMGLKQNWEEAMLQYQCLPVVCDNLYRKHTKERLEAQLKNIERDIELFEKHKMIYVA